MNTTDKLAEALRLAREWFRYEEAGEGPQAYDVIKAADEALATHDAEQAQEPVAVYVSQAALDWITDPARTPGAAIETWLRRQPAGDISVALTTPRPAQAERVGLTDEDIREIGNSLPPEHRFHSRAFARAVERAHGIGATTGKEPGNV